MAEYLIPPVIKLGDNEKDICCFNGAGTICFEPPCGLPTQFVEWECEGSTDGCSSGEHTRWSEFADWDCEGAGGDCDENQTQAALYESYTFEDEVPAGGPADWYIERWNGLTQNNVGTIRFNIAQLSCCPDRVRVTLTYEPWTGGDSSTVEFTFILPRGAHFQVWVNQPLNAGAWTPPNFGTLRRWRITQWEASFDGVAVCSATRKAKCDIEYDPS